MIRTYIAALGASGCIALAFTGAAEAGKIYTGGARGSYNGDFCPQLSTELAKAKFSYNCTPTLGSTENLEKVRQNPTDLGFSQFDVFTLATAKGETSQPYQIVRTDLARECLFMVTRNKSIANYGDIALHADRLHFILPPQGSGSAATFDYLRRIDPEGIGRAANVSYADTTDLALKRALEEDDTVSLFVQFPDPDNDRFKMVAKEQGFFVPVIDRNILRQQVGDQKIYFAEETEVKNAKFWKKGETVVTACTPMILFTGGPDNAASNEQKLDQADLVKTVQSIPLENLQPKQGWLSKYWSKTRAMSAEGVEKLMQATEKTREKAAPYIEQAKQKAQELGEKASPYVEQAKEKARELGEKAAPYVEQAKEKAKELGERAAPYVEQAKEKAKEFGGKAVEKAKELGDSAKEKLQQPQ